MSAFLSGCATTDQEMSEKDRAKLDREMQKTNKQNSQNQNKATGGLGQPKRAR